MSARVTDLGQRIHLGQQAILELLQAAVAEGVIGRLAPRFHGAPTDYSHRKTNEHDAPEMLRRLREDKADVAVLTAL